MLVTRSLTRLFGVSGLGKVGLGRREWGWGGGSGRLLGAGWEGGNLAGGGHLARTWFGVPGALVRTAVFVSEPCKTGSEKAACGTVAEPTAHKSPRPLGVLVATLSATYPTLPDD
jgi:hypothetical protein